MIDVDAGLNDNSDENSEEGKNTPLRHDIRMLGRMLGDTLREHEGEATFNLVESIRQTAIRLIRRQHLSLVPPLYACVRNTAYSIFVQFILKRIMLE